MKPFATTASGFGNATQLGEYSTAEHIREILMQEQDHQIALATALGIDVPNLNLPASFLPGITLNPQVPGARAARNRFVG